MVTHKKPEANQEATTGKILIIAFLLLVVGSLGFWLVSRGGFERFAQGVAQAIGALVGAMLAATFWALFASLAFYLAKRSKKDKEYEHFEANWLVPIYARMPGSKTRAVDTAVEVERGK